MKYNRRGIAILLLCVLMVMLSAGVLAETKVATGSKKLGVTITDKVLSYKVNGTVVYRDVYTKAALQAGVAVREFTGTAPAGQIFTGWKVNGETKLPGQTYSGSSSVDFEATFGTGTPVTITFKIGTKTIDKQYIKGEIISLPTAAALEATDQGSVKDWDGKAPGSSYTIPDTNTTLTATMASGKKDISVTITWDDSNNRDGIRPSASAFSTGVELSPAAGTKSIMDNGNSWMIIFSGVPDDSTVYTIQLPEVSGYVRNGNTYSRDDGQFGSMTVEVWITNKKWTDGGELIKFKAGQTVKFKILIRNNGSTPLTDIDVWEDMKNSKLKKGSGYKLEGGYAHIGYLGPGETATVYSSYRLTNSDVRKDKVVNVVGASGKRIDGTYTSDWDAVRIPINKKSRTSSGYGYATPTPLPTEIYMVQRLLMDMGAKLSVTGNTVEIVGAKEILTDAEYQQYSKLSAQDKLLTVLTAIGMQDVVSRDRIRLSLNMSANAQTLMNTIQNRLRTETAQAKAERQAVQNVYFPIQEAVVSGLRQRYFEISLRIRENNQEHVEKYTFRYNEVGEWSFVQITNVK